MLLQVNPYDFTQPLDARIQALADLDRVPLIEKLMLLEIQARGRARPGRRAIRNSIARARVDNAKTDSERLGRIIYFLRFRNLAERATTEDTSLCHSLADKLAAKGQWNGVYSL
jgi:hypothetical protein